MDAPAAELPVARVAVEVGLAHLDRTFDYAVPERFAAQALPGVRVRVRFAGAQVGGFVVERAETSDHVGPLAPLGRVVSPEPVLTAEVAGLARAIADRYAGTLADVLRLAIPPRHARVEQQPSAMGAAGAVAPPGTESWRRYAGGAAFVDALAAGRPARAVWTALPGEGWPAEVAAAVQAARFAGRGVLVVVPDARDVARVDAALTAALGAGALGAGSHVALTAEVGPTERYRRWLAIRRGAVRVVVGTRAAMFAPVADLGLVVVWDDGDDSHAEPRAPYPHVRDVLVLRAHRLGAAALVGGFARTAEGQALLASGWARAVVAPASVVRAAAPRIEPAGEDVQAERDPAARAARLPSIAWQAARAALAAGAPVLVQVPRRGYVPVLACDRCRLSARCPSCAGPLGQLNGAPGTLPSCRWCGCPAVDWQCPDCAGHRLRAVVVGARRTAEELGRAFPGVPVRTSGRDGVLATVPANPALVVSTPGAEPVAIGGYGAVLLLDGWALLGRADLRAGEETLRRWFAAAALARPGPAGGRVVVMAPADLAAVQALIRWDPAGAAARELAERAELRFPPAVRIASLTGSAAGVAEFLAVAELPATAELLGPVPVGPAPPGARAEVGAVPRGLRAASDEWERVLVRVPRTDGPALATALKAASAVRSLRRGGLPARVQLDPVELG
jgi:primosomal protein N' (replication factor Y)